MPWRLSHPLSLAARSWRQAADWVWHDVKVGILAGVGIIAVVAVFWREEWHHVLIATFAVWATLLVLPFLVNLILNIRTPARHEYWQPRPIAMARFDSNDTLVLTLMATDTALTRHRIACLVTDPNGIESQGETRFAGPIQRDSVISLQYPREFRGAPPALSGNYLLIWQEPDRKGKWREILRDFQTVEVGQAQ